MDINSKNNPFLNTNLSHATSPYLKPTHAHNLSLHQTTNQPFYHKSSTLHHSSSLSFHITNNNSQKQTYQQNISQSLILNAKWLITTIEQQVQLLVQHKADSKNNNGLTIVNRISDEIDKQLKQLIAIVRKLPSSQRVPLIIQLLGCLAQSSNTSFLSQIPIQQLLSYLNFLKNQFKEHLQQKRHNQANDYFKSSQPQILVSNKLKTNRKLYHSNSLHNLSKSLTKIHNSPQEVPANTYHANSHKTKTYTNFIDTLALNRIDSVVIFILSNPDLKENLISKFPQTPQILQTILNGLQNPIISKKLQLLYTKDQFQTHLSNIQSLSQELSNIFQFKNLEPTESKLGETSQLNQIQLLQKDIRQLMAQQMENRSKRQTNDPNQTHRSQSSDKLRCSNLLSLRYSHSMPKKFAQSSSNTFHLTSRGTPENLSSQTISMGYLTNRIKKWKYSANGFMISSPTKKNEGCHSNEKYETISASKCSENQKNKNTLAQPYQKNQLLSQAKISKSDSKGMNYNKVIPFRNSIIAGRSSILTLSVKNGMSVNNNFTNFDSFGNVPNEIEEEGCSKNMFGIKIPNYGGLNFSKQSKGVQRRSGFVGLTRKREVSQKRISTRWNNGKEGGFSNLFSESSFNKIEDASNMKVQIKSKFSLSKNKKQRANSYDEQSDSSSSCSRTEQINMDVKNSNQQSISFIGQTYNFFNYDRFSGHKIGSKQSALTLSNRNIPIIDQKLQQIRCKLFYIRLMTLLNQVLKIVITQTYLTPKYNLSDRKYQFRQNNRDQRKMTFYQSKYQVDRDNLQSNQKKIFTKHSKQSAHQQKRQQNFTSRVQNIYQGVTKLNKNQKKQFNQVEIKLKSIMDRYLAKKQESFQQNLRKCIRQVQQTQINTKLIESKVLKGQQELIIKPFYIFLQIQTEEEYLCRLNGGSEKPKKLMSYVMGSNKMQNNKKGNGSLIDKCTQISLKYQDETQSDRGILLRENRINNSRQNKEEERSEGEIEDKKQMGVFEKKYSTTNSLTLPNKNSIKKTISMFEPEQEKHPIRILQLPLNVIIKNEFEDRIIYKKVQLSFSLTIDSNPQSSKRKAKHTNTNQFIKNTLFKHQKSQSFKPVSGHFGIIEQNNTQNQSLNQSNIQQQQQQESSQYSQSSTDEFISSNGSEEASDECSESSSNSKNSDHSNQSFTETDSANSSDNQSDNSNESPQQNSSSSSKSSSHTNQRPINRTLSIESSVIQQNQNNNTNKNHIFIIKQNLQKGRIKKNKKQPIKMNWKHKDFSTQAFKDGYFNLEKIIQTLLANHFKVVKTQMGTKFCQTSGKNASKTSFQSTMKNKPKNQIRQKLKISKLSSTFKSLVEALPRDLCELESVLSKCSKDQTSKRRMPKTQFVNFILQIKIDNQTVDQKISQKTLIKLKYNKQTSKKSMFKLNDASAIVLKTYEKVNLIRKINTYFFLKDVLLITGKDYSTQQKLSTVFYEQVYCDTFHELYEREFIEFAQINSLTKEQNKNHTQHTNNVSFLFEKRFKNLFYTSKLKRLKKIIKPKPFNQNHLKPNQNNFIFSTVNNKLSNQEDSDQEFAHTELQLYSVTVEQIPQIHSKTQSLSVQFVEYYSHHEVGLDAAGITGHHLHFATKGKLASVFTYAQKLSKIRSQDHKDTIVKSEFTAEDSEKKMLYSLANTKRSQNLISGNERQGIHKNSKGLYNSCSIKRRANKRTTIEINKQINRIDQISQLISDFQDLNSNHKSLLNQKSKRNFGFIGNSTDSLARFPTLNNDLCNEGTQKQITQQTQKSLKSHQSRNRLHRHGYQISSLMPTSMNLKSSKHAELNYKGGFRNRTHCPSLSTCLNAYNELKNRKKVKKTSFYTHDNFIDLQPNHSQYKHKQDLLKTKSKWGIPKQNYQIQLINKNKFYDKNNGSFRTIVKRSKKYILCFVQWWAVSEQQFSIQIFTGLYTPNLSPLKIVSGKMHHIFFTQIFKSHLNLENYINCEIDCSFQINSGPIRDCLAQKSCLITDGLNETDLHDHVVIRPNLRIQKMIKVKLLSRFVKHFRNSSGPKNSQSKTPQSHFIIVTIFIYESLPNQNVYFHLYVPKNSKNFIFDVQGSIFYGYLNDWIDQYSKDKNANYSIKNSLIEKQSEKQIVVLKDKRKPRLSIFSPLSQISCRQDKSEQDFLGLPIKTNSNLGSSQFSSGKDPFRSIDSNLSLKKKSSSVCQSQDELNNKERAEPRIFEGKNVMNWKQICQQIFKIRKKIKFHQLFQLNSQNDSYVVEFNNKRNVKFEGIEILSKKVHFSMKEEQDERTKEKRLKIVPDAIEVVSLEYSEKKFSLLNLFNQDAFGKIRIKQRFTKYQLKLQNSHYFSYNLQELLMRNLSLNKNGIRKSVTKSLFPEQKSRDLLRIINEDSEVLGLSKKSQGEKIDGDKIVESGKKGKLQKKRLQISRRHDQTESSNLMKTKITQATPNKMIKQGTARQEITNFTKSILSKMMNNTDLINSLIKKFNPHTKHHKTILYSELLDEFRNKCEISSFKKFQTIQKLQKTHTIFIKQTKFSLNQQTITANTNTLKNSSKTLKNRQKTLNESSKTLSNAPFDLRRSFIKIKFIKSKKDQNSESQSDTNGIVGNQAQDKISVRIQNLFGQKICEFDSEKMEQLFPFASKFSSSQMKKFLKRIVKDENTLEYLKIKNLSTKTSSQ